MLTDEEREWKRNNLRTKAIPKAKEWHSSEEGMNWHKQQVLSRKDNRSERHLVCINCGKAFTIFSNKDSKYCSNACKSAYRRKQGADIYIERKCIVCGISFLVNGNSTGFCCSAKCRAIYGHQNRKHRCEGLF